MAKIAVRPELRRLLDSIVSHWMSTALVGFAFLAFGGWIIWAQQAWFAGGTCVIVGLAFLLTAQGLQKTQNVSHADEKRED